MEWAEGYPQGFRGGKIVWVVCEFQMPGWGKRYETFKWDGKGWDKDGIKNAERWALLTSPTCPAPYTKCNKSRRGECCYDCLENEECEEACLNHPSLCFQYLP